MYWFFTRYTGTLNIISDEDLQNHPTSLMLLQIAGC